MTTWWLRVLGLGDRPIPAGARTEWALSLDLPHWAWLLLLVAAAGAVYGVFWLYRREASATSRRVRLLLAGLRSAALVVLLLVLAGPVLRVWQRHSVQPTVVVLLDESASMSIADRYTSEAMAAMGPGLGLDETARANQPIARAALVDRVLAAGDGSLLKQLARRGRVRVLGFSNRIQARAVLPMNGETPPAEVVPTSESGAAEAAADGSGGGAWLAPISPTGAGTDLAKAVREALRGESSGPIAAVVLFTDGQSTEGDQPMAAAEAAAAQGVPLLVVGVGDATPPRNVRVVDVWAPPSVWRDDPFTMEAPLQYQGAEPATVTVEMQLREVDAEGRESAEQSLGRKQVTLAPGGGDQSVVFEHRIAKPGRFIVSVRAESLPGEVIESDNVRTAAVTVLSDQARVLLVAGAPTWDYEVVRALLQRDKTIDLSCWQQSMDLDVRQDGDTPIARLPSTAEELFKYDVILLMDPNPSPIYNPTEMNAAWMDLLRRFVGEHGGGLLFMAGPGHTAKMLADPQAGALRDVLPVSFSELATHDARQLTMDFRQALPLQLTTEGQTHPVARLDSDARRTATLWSRMPGVYWTFPSRGPKPASRVLLETIGDAALRERARSLMVAGQYGPGRTLYLGFDGTWRWRRLGHDSEYFDRFWIQAVRFLVEGRRIGGQRRGQITLDREVVAVGAPVTIGARLYQPTFEPMNEPVVAATIESPGAAPVGVELRAVEGRPGQYEGSVVATRVGAGEIVVQLPGSQAGEVVRLTRRFTAELPRVEFVNAAMNQPLLEEMASRSGGRFFSLAAVGELADAVPDRMQVVTVPDKPVDLWDTDRLLLVLVAMLAMEWVIRKRQRMM